MHRRHHIVDRAVARNEARHPGLGTGEHVLLDVGDAMATTFRSGNISRNVAGMSSPPGVPMSRSTTSGRAAAMRAGDSERSSACG
jgi:hypothetical protein